jgi:hypothetical protein
VNLPLSVFEKGLAKDEGEFSLFSLPFSPLSLSSSPVFSGHTSSPFTTISTPAANPPPSKQRPNPSIVETGDFVKEFGWRRPSKTTPVVVYCKAGIRAQTAVDLLKAKGWKWCVSCSLFSPLLSFEKVALMKA